MTHDACPTPNVSPFDAEPLSDIARRIDGNRRSVAELIPWLFKFNDQLIVNKDSALMASYTFTGPDTDSLSATRVHELVRNVIHAMRPLARAPITLWWTVHRRRTDRYLTAPLPDPIAQRVDDALQRTFKASANYVNRHTLTMCMAPEVGVDRFAKRFMHGVTHEQMPILAAFWQAVRATFSDQYLFAHTASDLAVAVDTFERLMEGFVAGNPDLDLERLTGEKLGAHLHACVSPSGEHLSRLAVPETPALDTALADAEIIPGHDYLKFDANARCRIGVAAGIPTGREFWSEAVSPTTLDGLLKIPGELTINHVFRLATPSAAMRFLNRMRRYHENRRLDTRALLAAAIRGGDVEHAPRQNEARRQAAALANRQVGKVEMAEDAYGYYNLSIISYSSVYDCPMGEDALLEADALAREEALSTHKAVEGVLHAAHFVPVRETLHALSAFATTIPGMWRECARWAFLDDQLVARLFPLRGVSRGMPVNRHLTKETGQLCPALTAFPTEYGTPFWFTAFVHDVGHLLVCGRTGFGKTMFLLLCATLFRKYPNTWTIGLDKDRSMRIPTILQGGRYMSFEADATDAERSSLNPLRLLAHARHLDFLVEWVKTLIEARGAYHVSAKDLQEIQAALFAARTCGPRLWRLSTIHASVPTGPMADELSLWVGDGPYAHYFDNLEDSFDVADNEDAGRWVSMATDRLLATPATGKPFLVYLAYRIEQSILAREKSGRIGATLVMLPEIWHLLDDEAFAERIGNWIVTMRKKLGCVWMDAQSPEQVSSSKIWPQIRDNVLVRVFVPTENLTPSARTAYQRDFGLSDAQIAVIQSLVRKRDYFITEVSGASRRISTQLGAETIAILRSEMSAQVLFDRHLRSGAPDWRERYIAEAIEQSHRQTTENASEVDHV
ncbi:conjugal transfer protein TraC [Trinickia symbiotica]|uniref:Conjugal transfer protein TraC n=1 Tax=Trinickia symbiotica TaxID=863227 RepID=A0A2T3XMQ2_9BURK|nr:VirB4 family type IV secretion system protein [Trinickia symbiotica]PTB17786.1 conjugal transfer protein TraC [Trinickia symbiotica]